MTFEILMMPTAKKQLKKLDRKVQGQIIKALERIRIRPDAFITKLVGVPGYKLRVGEYRVILEMDRGKLLILVLKVGHRRNIYDI
jgi:mRNA interferase RelE/StbE